MNLVELACTGCGRTTAQRPGSPNPARCMDCARRDAGLDDSKWFTPIGEWHPTIAHCLPGQLGKQVGAWHKDGEPPAPPATHLVLDTIEVPIGEAPKLAAQVVAAGGWARCVKVLAESHATASLVESVSVRVRLLGMGGYAMWVDGHAAGASVIAPYRKRLSHEGLQVALGLLEITYGDCDHWRIPWAHPCGKRDVRVNADGSLRAHKTVKGLKCW